jgi:hypothetical protein
MRKNLPLNRISRLLVRIRNIASDDETNYISGSSRSPSPPAPKSPVRSKTKGKGKAKDAIKERSLSPMEDVKPPPSTPGEDPVADEGEEEIDEDEDVEDEVAADKVVASKRLPPLSHLCILP